MATQRGTEVVDRDIASVGLQPYDEAEDGPDNCYTDGCQEPPRYWINTTNDAPAPFCMADHQLGCLECTIKELSAIYGLGL